MTKWAVAVPRDDDGFLGDPRRWAAGRSKIEGVRLLRGRTPSFYASVCDFIATPSGGTVENDERALKSDTCHLSLLMEPPITDEVSVALAPPATLIAPPIAADAS